MKDTDAFNYKLWKSESSLIMHRIHNNIPSVFEVKSALRTELWPWGSWNIVKTFLNLAVNNAVGYYS